MRNPTDLLSPDSSPKQLKKNGVKRVNNVPLGIAGAVLILFILLIALVAHKRANAQYPLIEPMKGVVSKKNTLSLAYDVIGAHKSEAVLPPIQAESTLANTSPPQNLQTYSSPADVRDEVVSDNELERIRQEKMQEFEEAVKAKTTISIDNRGLNNRDNGAKAFVPNAQGMDNTLSFQEPQNGKPVTLSLGGAENALRWHLNSQLENPNTPYELRAGGVIPGVMISGISSDLPGQIIGQVSQNVYDTPTGKYLLIPQGTKLIGVYGSDVRFGQNSVLVAWQRLVFPDGKAFDIGSMPGADSAGFAGFRDQVDNHYVRIYGSALMMSAIIGGITYSQNANATNPYGYSQPTAGNVLSQALGQQLGEVTSQLISKNLNVAPTVNVRPGYRFNIIVVKDLTFNQPYRQFVYAKEN